MLILCTNALFSGSEDNVAISVDQFYTIREAIKAEIQMEGTVSRKNKESNMGMER